MRLDLSLFESLIFKGVNENIDRSKEFFIEYIKKNYDHLSEKLVQAQVEYLPDEDTFKIMDKVISVYESNYELKTKKPKYFEINNPESNYWETFNRREEILNFIRHTYNLNTALLSRAQITRTSENIYKIEAVYFKDNIYTFSLEDLQFLYFKDILSKEFYKKLKELEEIINKSNGKYNEIIETNLKEILKLKQIAEARYLTAISHCDKLHEYYHKVWYYLCFLIMKIHNEFKAVDFSERVKMDNTLKLCDYEFDECKLMRRVFNSFFKLFEVPKVSIELSATAQLYEQLPEEYPYTEKDFDFKYNDYTSKDEYKSFLSKKLVEFKFEIIANIESCPSWYAEYIGSIREKIKSSLAYYNIIQIAMIPGFTSYPSRLKLDLTHDNFLPPNPQYILTTHLSPYVDVEMEILNSLEKYLDSETAEILRKVNTEPAERPSKPVRKFGDTLTYHQRIHGYNFRKLFEHIKSNDVSTQLNYLTEVRTEYHKQHYSEHELNFWGETFIDEVNFWIKKLKPEVEIFNKDKQRLEDALDAQDSKISIEKRILSAEIKKTMIPESPKELPKNIWNKKINILVDILIQLNSEIKTESGKPALGSTPQQLTKLIVDNFVDENGKPFKPGSILTMFSPSKDMKRPKKPKRIEVTELITKAEKKITAKQN